jgi:hypothetical protein
MDDVSFIENTGLRSHEAALKGVQFISHPLWRTYVFCYSGGAKRRVRPRNSAAGSCACSPNS